MSQPMLPIAIDRHLRRYIRRRRAAGLLRAVALALTAGLVLVLTAALLDRFFHFPAAVRAGVLVLTISAVAGVLLWPVWRIVRRGAGGSLLRASLDLERAHPAFEQRLHTVVSQFLEQGRYRGSDQFLHYLAAEVAEELRRVAPRAAAGWGRAVWPSATAMVLGTVAAALLLVPTLGLPSLCLRILMPMAAIQPVTTTRISVEPGDVQIEHGRPLVIRASVERGDGSAPRLLSSPDGRNWTAAPMQGDGDGQWKHAIAAVEHNLRYRIAAGDATTPAHRITVLRPPAIGRIDVTFVYPDYTRRDDFSTTVEGVIEALEGTELLLAITAIEPLAAAALLGPDESTALALDHDARSAHGRLAIAPSRTLDLEMISEGGIRTVVRSAVTLRAQADREPLVRLLQPADDLRLHARDLLPVEYTAMDDYGLEQLEMLVQVNSGDTRHLSIPRGGDPRRLEGQYVLDLAPLEVQVGDVVTLALRGVDGAGQSARSPSRHVLVSPRSIDINTHIRIAELKQAAALSQTAHEELLAAAESMEMALGAQSELEAMSLRLDVSRSVSSALEASLLLHQSMLRCIARSPGERHTLLLMELLDNARTQASLAEWLAGVDPAGPEAMLMDEKLRYLAEVAMELAGTVRILSEAEQAEAILADRANIESSAAAIEQADADQRLTETLRRARQDVDSAVQQLGLRPDARNLTRALEQRGAAATRLLQAAAPVDYADAAAQWAQAVVEAHWPTPPLAERLVSAATAEAVRPDSLSIRARDLQLASQAVRRLQRTHTRPPDPGLPVPAWVEDLPAAMLALQAEHQLLQREEDAADARRIIDAAAGARLRLLQWSGQQPTLAALTGAGDVEELAFEASALARRRNYGAVREIDTQLYHSVQTDQQRLTVRYVQETMESAEQIDRLAAQQEGLQARTADQLAPEVIDHQLQVARGIARIGQRPPAPDAAAGARAADDRRAVAAAVQRTQEQLADIPRRMADAQQAAAAFRQARRDADRAHVTADLAGGDRPAAARAAEQADRIVAEMRRQLDQVAAAITPETAATIAGQLSPFDAEAHHATRAIVEQLQPALSQWQRDIRTDDIEAIDASAAQVRESVERAQLLLKNAQARLIERDPIVAARWFAEAATHALTERDVYEAQSHQQRAAGALRRAWQESLREAETQRLTLVPSVAPVLASPDAGAEDAHGLDQRLPGLRHWGFLRQRLPDFLTAPLHRPDAPTYDEALRLYFDALGRASEESQ